MYMAAHAGQSTTVVAWCLLQQLRVVMAGWLCSNTKWSMRSLQVRRTPQLSHCACNNALRDAPRVHTVKGHTKRSRMHPQGWQGNKRPHRQLVAVGHMQRRQLLVLTTLAVGPLIRGGSCIHAARNNKTPVNTRLDSWHSGLIAQTGRQTDRQTPISDTHNQQEGCCVLVWSTPLLVKGTRKHQLCSNRQCYNSHGQAETERAEPFIALQCI